MNLEHERKCCAQSTAHTAVEKGSFMLRITSFCAEALCESIVWPSVRCWRGLCVVIFVACVVGDWASLKIH